MIIILDTMKNEATGLTERETARRAYDIARGFVRNFDSSFENLFLYGDTGVGKTFFLTVLLMIFWNQQLRYVLFSAFDLFELLADSKFSRDKTEGQEFVFDSDLLIIDDLGTELTNSFVSSQLFLCINERIMRRKSTIISTNLKLENFSDTYSERTFFENRQQLPYGEAGSERISVYRKFFRRKIKNMAQATTKDLTTLPVGRLGLIPLISCKDLGEKSK